jgi:hypothetical protein
VTTTIIGEVDKEVDLNKGGKEDKKVGGEAGKGDSGVGKGDQEDQMDQMDQMDTNYIDL